MKKKFIRYNIMEKSAIKEFVKDTFDECKMKNKEVSDDTEIGLDKYDYLTESMIEFVLHYCGLTCEVSKIVHDEVYKNSEHLYDSMWVWKTKIGDKTNQILYSDEEPLKCNRLYIWVLVMGK